MSLLAVLPATLNDAQFSFFPFLLHFRGQECPMYPFNLILVFSPLTTQTFSLTCVQFESNNKAASQLTTPSLPL